MTYKKHANDARDAAIREQIKEILDIAEFVATRGADEDIADDVAQIVISFAATAPTRAEKRRAERVAVSAAAFATRPHDAISREVFCADLAEFVGAARKDVRHG